jgi:hypothetical protein
MRLIEPAIVAREYGDAGGLPLCALLLDVLDDEADVVDRGPDRAAGWRRRTRAQMQENDDAGKFYQLEIAGLDRNAAHGHEYLLVGFDVARIEMPVPHGHAGFVRRHGLRQGRSGGEVRCEPQC